MAPSRSSQRPRALSVDIRRAFDSTALAGGGAEVHGDVETVNKRNVEKVLVTELVQGVFRQGVWRVTPALAVQDAAAVAGLAPAAPAGVEVAVGSAPDSGHFGAGGDVEGPGLAAVQAAAATGRSGCPDGVGALVGDLEGGGMDGGDEGEEGENKEEAEVAHTGRLGVGAEHRGKWMCFGFWLLPHQ